MRFQVRHQSVPGRRWPIAVPGRQRPHVSGLPWAALSKPLLILAALVAAPVLALLLMLRTGR